MEYITLDARFNRAFIFNFVILNHFRHNMSISFPYYLHNYFVKIPNEDCKDPSKPILYEGLMMLIYKYGEKYIVGNKMSLKDQ